MAKKTKRYDAGGEIVVTGRRSSPEISAFDLSRIGGMGGMGNAAGMSFMGGSSGGGGGGASSQRIAELTAPSAGAKARPAIVPAVIRQPQTTLGNLAGARSPKGYGATFRGNFAKGGKAEGEPTGGKKKSKAKRYATGGSTASKRADGCAIKGKTKGRFV